MNPTIGNATSYPTQSYGPNSSDNNSAGFVTPYKLNSGVMRGTQIIQNPDGSKTTIGQIGSSTDYGIALYDKNNNIIQKIVGATTYYYDAAHNFTNFLQIGTLPDGSGGLVVAKPGITVASLFV